MRFSDVKTWAIWSWVRSHSEPLNLAANCAGVVASIVIAWIAIAIDSQIQSNAIKEARISRSVALAQSLFADDAIKRSLMVANLIEMEANKRSDPDRNSEGSNIPYKSAQIRAIQEQIAEQGEALYSDIFLIEQHIRRATNCMGLLDQEDGSASVESLCDASTYLILAGDVVQDLWWQLRPIYTCDERVEARKQIDYFKAIIKNTPQRQRDDPIRIFETKQDYDREHVEGRYAIIEFGDKHCNEYQEGLPTREREVSITNATAG